MIPILYEATETAFVSNGICRLRDCLSCVVTEERNGIYECDFEYPVDGAHFADIIPGRIIAVEHDETNDIQPFDIISYSKPLNGIVTFHAVHISYRLTGAVVKASNINSLAGALAAFRDSIPSNQFTYETDKTSTGYVGAFDGTPRPIRQILGGVEGSLLDAYGGEYEWDKWTVRLLSARGEKKNFTIKYGVNLLDYNDDTDYSGVYTTCIPFWRGQDDQGLDVIVTGNKVDPLLNEYASREICVPMDLSDKFETQPTTAQLEAMALARMLTDNVDTPAQSITVDFLRIEDMNEYKQFELLFKCKLCDTITLWFPRYKVNADFKIVKTEYNVLDERYNSLELGTLSTSLADVIGVNSDSGQGNLRLPYVLKAGDSMTGDLVMANQKYYYGLNRNGERRIVCGISNSDTYMFGYGSRNSNEGASYFDGHVVYVRSNGAVYIIAPGGVAITGDLTTSGVVTVEGHDRPIGWYDAHSGTVSCASSSSFTSIDESAITLKPGRYIVTGSFQYNANGNGVRGLMFSIGGSGRDESSVVIPNSTASYKTRIQSSMIVVVTEETTLKLAYLQNSGSALSANWIIKAMVIS